MAKCIRCYSEYVGPPHLMAGRPYCCASCSVGSACEHQGVKRAAPVRRYDAMFDRFRLEAKRRTAYEPLELGHHDNRLEGLATEDQLQPGLAEERLEPDEATTNG